MNKKIKKAFISIDDNEIKDQLTKKLVDAGVSIITKNKLEDILKCDLVVTHLKEINYELEHN